MKKSTIGWIGTGVMGSAMAEHLLQAGYSLVIFNRSKNKAQNLIAQGAVWTETPAKVAESCDILFTMVGYPHDVEEVYMDPENGIFVNPKCRIVIDMTTSSPDLAIHLADKARTLDIYSLDAPVSGGDIGARNATLAIMVGGDKAIFEEIFPIFLVLGKKIKWMGPSGSGQHTKMCNQILIATTMIGTCEALLYAERAGLDEMEVIDIIGSGAAGSWSINQLGPRIVVGDDKPGFYVEHFLKDMGIALDECRRMKVNLPGLELTYQLYRKLLVMGKSRCGTQSLIYVLHEMNCNR